ncbi:MAG TPA: sodium:solute symporter family protein, partial [Planctomycetota bacterium]|nr:sodium:solute symporter family protein [Planctomycetota bacterium]
MSIALVDWVIIVGYLVFALLVGLVFTRRAGKSTREFFISGRNLPWWIAGTSMVATSFASDTPLVITGWVRKGGIAENWIWWSWAAGGMFSVFLLSRLWRRAEVVTDVELTELRYSGRPGAALRGFRAAYLAIPINSIIMAWVIVAMAKFMNVLFLDPSAGATVMTPYVKAVIICITIATVYSVLSGFWGVVVTDFVQFIIAMGGSIALAVLAVRHVGGLDALREHAAAASSLGTRLLRFFPEPPDGAALMSWEFWQTPFFAFLVYISVQWWANKNADGGGIIIQRMVSSKNERHALLATLWFNVAHYALRPWPWILVALVSVAVLPNLADGEAAYPEMVKALAPAGLLGLIIASFLAAFMSTIDSTLNLSSSYVVNDFYRRFVRKDASERHYVGVSRVASVYFMILASCIAVMFDSISGLFKFLLAFSSGVGLVYIGRWFWWRINAWSEISAMVASSAIASCLYLWGREGLTYPHILLMTVAGSTLVWMLVTFA